jgi:branched-chain amino acid transport system substrate-binding protein
VNFDNTKIVLKEDDMKKRGLVLMVSCLLFLLALFSLSGSFTKEATAQVKTLKIGLITSVTGQMAPAFKPLYDAVKPTEDLMNQRGGVIVKGQKYNIKIVAEDDQSSPPGAIAAANRLIQQGIKFMIPPMFMVTDLALIPTAEEAKILRIKPFGMGPEEVNPKIRYGFFADSSLNNIEPCFDYLVKTYPKTKRIAIIMPDDPGATTALDLNVKAIQKHGLQLVFTEKFKIGSEDFYPILTKALEQKPDAINGVVSIVPWAAGLINQSRELGFTGPIYAPCIFGDINLINGIVNKKYAYDIFHGGPDVLSDKMLPVMKDLRKLVEKANQPFIMDSMLGLDSLYPMLQCIEKAQSLDPDKVVATIEKMKDIDTIWGKGKWGGKEIFGVDHVIIRPVTLSRIVNGKVEQLDFIEK